MSNQTNMIVRTRFAPAPTGVMHIGNVRAALLNYLFARQKQGTFILRIEDTDAQRMFDTDAKEILFDLNWLGLTYDEGPGKDGTVGPYFQSQRTAIYQKALDYLIEKNYVYCCFCTSEELEKKRQRQIALKQPPRYDKTCLILKPKDIEKKLAENEEFIWRFNISANQEIIVHDLAKGSLQFNTNNLTDFPLTRTDGSFTFLFANVIDDISMEITHVFRGEDHLTNSASQLLIYRAFNRKEPAFLHLPIICNLEGKKLSKRDFGFSIKDLQDDGYLPEAVCNYLGILGSSYKEEILSLADLIREYDFDNLSSTSQIKYDPNKLRWLNHKWLQKISLQEFLERSLPFIKSDFPDVEQLKPSTLEKLLTFIRTDIHTFKEIPEHIRWYFEKPELNKNLFVGVEQFDHYAGKLAEIIEKNLVNIANVQQFIDTVKIEATQQNIPTKTVFQVLRISLTSCAQGPHLGEIIDLLGADKATFRLKDFIKFKGEN